MKNGQIFHCLLASLAIISLAGCGGASRESANQSASKPSTIASPKATPDSLTDLFKQPFIDPLTDYIKANENNSDKKDQLAKVRAERKRRCREIDSIYAKREANYLNLARLEKNYRYSCPALVETFAKRVTETQAGQQDQLEKAVAKLPSNETTSSVDSGALQTCEKSIGVADFVQAFTQCKPPAEQGNAHAQYYLALMYEEGKGTETDDVQAIAWYQKSAAGNFAEAQSKLGIRYYTGEGVAQNYVKAAELQRKAAEQGNADAQFILGTMYELGQGVPQNFVLAYKWFLLASAQGSAGARDSRQDLAAKLNSEQIAEAQRLAQQNN